MRQLLSKDVASGLMFTAVGALGLILMMGVDFGTTARPGPGFFPVVLSALLALIGVVQTALGLIQNREAIPPMALRPLVLIICSVCVFAFCVGRFGLVPSIFVATMIATYAQPDYGMRPRVILAAALSIFCSLLFVYALNLPIALWTF